MEEFLKFASARPPDYALPANVNRAVQLAQAANVEALQAARKVNNLEYKLDRYLDALPALEQYDRCIRGTWLQFTASCVQMEKALAQVKSCWYVVNESSKMNVQPHQVAAHWPNWLGDLARSIGFLMQRVKKAQGLYATAAGYAAG